MKRLKSRSDQEVDQRKQEKEQIKKVDDSEKKFIAKRFFEDVESSIKTFLTISIAISCSKEKE